MVPDASSESSKDGNADDSELDPIALSKWERCAAGLIGVVLAGFGVWAIFVVDSEVDPPALVLIAAVFLLLSVQGTAIRRANRDSVELDRRASPRQIAREAATLLEEEGPIEAEAFIEGASAAAPSLMRSPAFSNVQDIIRRARSYERDVRYAIESSMDYEIVLYSNQLDEDADFTLKSRSPNGQMIDCVVKYSEGIQRGFIASLREIIRRLQPGLRLRRSWSLQTTKLMTT
jgi:hypothetical protein